MLRDGHHRAEARGLHGDTPIGIATETGGNQLSNHGLIQLDDGRNLLGITHHRDVRPLTSDPDIAIFDEPRLDPRSRAPYRYAAAVSTIAT